MVFQNDILAGASGAKAYEIDQSCRFNDDDTPYMHRTPGSSGNTSTWTLSVWLKRGSDVGSTSTQEAWFGAGDGGGDTGPGDLRYDHVGFYNDQIQFGTFNGFGANLLSTALFRDPTAWYHIVLRYDDTQSTPADRVRLYVNSVAHGWTTTNFPDEDKGSSFNAAYLQRIGTTTVATNRGMDGYMAEMVMIDGTSLGPESFGETNSTTGQWVAKEITGLTFGTNGFHMKFQNSSALGDDSSGNNNDYTTSGLASTDQLSDSPTDNFSTWNPLQKNADATLSDGNLQAAPEGSNQQDTMTSSTIIIPSGSKMYAEFAVTGQNTGMVGIQKENEWGADWDAMAVGSMRILHIASGDVYNADSEISVSNYAPNDDVPVTLMVAVDLVNDNMYIGDASTDKWSDGSGSYDQDFDESPGAISLTADLNWKFVTRLYNATVVANFGQSSFTGTKPTGYNAVSTAGLDDPTIADPSAYFQSTLYTGNGSTQSIDQDGNKTFEPDFVWLKNRDASDNHCVFDSVRGVTNVIFTNNADVQTTDADTLTAFDSDGFSLGDDDKVNTNTEKYVGWQWLESNTPALDIVQYEGTGSKQTVSHGLGVAPDLIIFKNIDSAQGWAVYHRPLGPEYEIRLSTTTAAIDDAAFYDDDNPTSSVFTVNTNSAVNGSGNTHIAYVFAEVAGYSKFGKYNGNANTNGPFVNCGFKPAFLIVKQTTATEGWLMFTSTIDTYNVVGDYFFANANSAEVDSAYVDFLSNGFKVRINGSGMNGSTSDSHIFMAWAETPFKTATAR